MTQVGWLQGESLFVDLRQPHDLAANLSGANCLNALTWEDCLALAGQQGFAGRLVQHKGAYEWVRAIDYRPPSGVRDLGLLFWQDGILVEQGVEIDYIEHWHRDPSQPVRPCAGVHLRSPQDNAVGFLLRVGGLFMYARSREPTVAGADLTALVAGAESLSQARALVNFEISAGVVTPDGWRITRSSLPYKIGAVFAAMPARDSQISIVDENDAGKPFARDFEIIGADGDQSALFFSRSAKVSDGF